MGRLQAVPQAHFRSPAASMRGAIDSLAQGSLVDLFAAYDVALAPVPRIPGHVPADLPQITAAIDFTREAEHGEPGQLTLSLPPGVLELMNREAAESLAVDWARELANQLLGRLKNRLLQLSVRLRLGVASGMDSSALAQQILAASSPRIYGGRTRRGDIVMTLRGMPEESELRYVGATTTVAEGAALLF